MLLTNIHYPAVEYPNFKYNNDEYNIINVPLKNFSKQSPSLREIKFTSENKAVVQSLQNYFSNSDDVIKYSRLNKKYKRYEQFEKTRQQSNVILFQLVYCSVLFILVIMWYFFFRY